MKSKQQFFVVSLISLGVACVVFFMYFSNVSSPTGDASKDVDRTVPEPRDQVNDVAANSPVPVAPVNVDPWNESAVAVNPLDWPLTVNQKYGFSYRQPDSYADGYPFYVETDPSDVPLNEYVKNIWLLNKNDTNPNYKGKTVSEIEQTEINGNEAYQFTLSKSFTWDQGGYILYEPHIYTFFETAQGIKVTAYAPVNDPYHQMVLHSFVVDESLIPANEAPSSWQQARYDLYEFKFPANLFTISDESSTQEGQYLQDVVEGMRGGVSITLTNEQFDPGNIQGPYGKIEDLEKVTLGGITWYAYPFGDAGAGARIYLTGIENSHTLTVSFGSMREEEVYPIVDDVVLQRLMLETFTF